MFQSSTSPLQLLPMASVKSFALSKAENNQVRVIAVDYHHNAIDSSASLAAVASSTMHRTPIYQKNDGQQRGTTSSSDYSEGVTTVGTVSTIGSDEGKGTDYKHVDTPMIYSSTVASSKHETVDPKTQQHVFPVSTVSDTAIIRYRIPGSSDIWLNSGTSEYWNNANNPLLLPTGPGATRTRGTTKSVRGDKGSPNRWSVSKEYLDKYWYWLRTHVGWRCSYISPINRADQRIEVYVVPAVRTFSSNLKTLDLIEVSNKYTNDTTQLALI